MALVATTVSKRVKEVTVSWAGACMRGRIKESGH
jgi:hypothetical protein